MQNTFKNYEPVGPLSYLLMDMNDNMKLGLYNKIDENRLVFIFKMEQKHYVLNSSQEQIDLLFANKIELNNLIYDNDISVLTDLENQPLPINVISEIKNHFFEQLNGSLEQQKNFKVYPDCFYVYKNHFWKS